MESKTYKKCKTILLTCLFVLVPNSTAASIESITTATPKLMAPSGSRFILDTANLDLDKDGCISGKQEMEIFKQHVLDALEGTPDSVLRAHSIVHRTDINRDGKICWCDFISIYLLEKASMNKHPVPFSVIPDDVMFSQLDENGDGQLTGDEKNKLQREFESCLPHHRAQAIVTAVAEQQSKDDSISHGEYQEFFNTSLDPAPRQNSTRTADNGNKL